MPSKPIQWMMLTILIALWLVTGSQPVNPAPISNLSREGYDNALAKWNSLHATEYEETVSVWTHDGVYWGKWKVVVDGDDATGQKAEGLIGSATFTHFEALEDPDDNVPLDQNFIWVKVCTVGNLFHYADQYLKDQHLQKPPRDEWAPGVLIMQFDPTMGYPRYNTYIGGDFDRIDLSIENVKVLK